jgi:hypothetical protein
MVARRLAPALPVTLVTLLALGAAGCSSPEAADGEESFVDESEDALTMAWPTLRSGVSNEDVTTVQYLLRASGASIAVDGSFGPGTDAAVRAFQRTNGLTADGVVGASTWAKLIRTIGAGSRGPAVEAVQYLLRGRYARPVTITGTVDTATSTQIKAFQQSRCLTADGVVGALTWNALVGRTSNCGGGGTSGGSGSGGTSGGPAARILGAHRAGSVTLWNQTFGRFDGADPLNNVTDAAAGRPARRSCYGTAPCGSVYLQSRMLNAVAALREQYGFRFFVTSIAGASHSAGSYHYAGRAIDVDQVNGVRINGNSAAADQFVSACRALGAVEAFGPRNDPRGHWDHLHCAW